MNRRKFLRFFGIGAATAIPIASYAKLIPASEKAAGPTVLERVCDGGKSEMSAEEWAQWEKEFPNRYNGCGTRFRWYLGTPCFCPNCGRHYIYTQEHLKKKVFFVQS